MVTIDKSNIIYTKQLLLRPFTMDDVQDFHALCNDPDVMQYIGDGSIPSLSAIEASIGRWIKHYEKHGYGLLALEHQELGELMGFCGLITQNIDGIEKIELGYRLGKQYWHEGYGTQAALIMRDHAFNTHQINELISIIQPGNIASRRIAEKLGMRIFKECDYNGQPVCIYQMFRNDFITG